MRSTLDPAIPSARERLLSELSEELRHLDEQGLSRQVTVLEAVDGPLVRIHGRSYIAWCSNDYLGLSTHPALAEAAAQAARAFGIGARASRLLAGTTLWHARLEEALAAWFGTEAALVYPSGYLANLGTLGALLSSADVVFVDRLSHASLVDAARATRAALRVFHHNDVGHLRQLLARAAGSRRRLIVTEGVFSMEGDTAPLAEFVELARTSDALLYVDDAHGAFVLGETGRGSPEALGLSHEPFLYMGTLGKALGCQGGFVVGPKTLIDFLRHRARTFIYTTALAVPVVAAAVEALRVLKEEPQRRQTLAERVRALHERLGDRHRSGKERVRRPSHIVPLLIGEATQALEVARQLWDRGIWAPAIRPPTVPAGSARLRLSVTALHTGAQIDALVEALEGVGALAA